MPKVFLITGCSTGFGAALVQEVLNRGDIAIATARSPEKLSFHNTTPSNYLALRLDVSDQASITAAFAAALHEFQRVDVVVNNAGYGLAGVLEELSEAEIQKQMDVNFFGVVRVTKEAMRVMRDENKPSGGLIQQITSIGGQLGMPLLSMYCAGKWAVEGLTESISKEVKPEWGIKFCCIEPGGFKTDWAHRSMAYRDEGAKLAAYAHMDAKEGIQGMAEKQVGDPVKAAKAIYELALVDDPPLRVPLGSEAFGAMEWKLKDYGDKYKQFESVAKPVDVDA